jgi:DNA repair protein RecO (recombination protein O)
MSLKYRTRGFVFKKNERAESDQAFSVFTKDFGRLEITARAVRKITSKLRRDFDIFYLSEVEFIQGKNNKTLTDAVKIKKFNDTVKDLKSLKTICQIADVLDSFIKGQEKDEAIFYLLEETLNNLSANASKIKNQQLLFQYFFWNFLSSQGYKLEANNCAICRAKLNPYNVYFSNKEGGVVCKKCSLLDKNAQKINSDIVKILRLIFSKDWNTISKLKVQPASQKLLESVYESAVMAFCPVHC